MKILVVSNMYPSKEAPSYGTFVKNFCDQLNILDIKYEKIVMTKKSAKCGGKLLSRFIVLFGYLFYYIKMMTSILFKKYDYIYVHYASHNALPLLVMSRIKKINIYTNVHGSDVVPQTSTQKRMQRYTDKLLKISKKVIAPSLYFKDLLINRYNLDNSKIYIYPSAGVNEELFFPYSKEEVNSITSINDIVINRDYEYIGYVGRIEPGKGWETFLKALAILKDKNKLEGKRIIVVGNGRQYDDFITMTEELALKDYLLLIKALPQSMLPKVYNSISLFCFPTEREGESLGLVALEALCCGTPVIASDFAAPKEYITDNYNGFKFTKGNSSDLADSIECYLNLTPENKRHMRLNSYESGSKYYSKALLPLLQDILINS